ncbi:MAG: ABC transporter ATP-binding protein [Clostridia bacterium]|nr:ABC transporter ATP-binding protein [Clostridia bacterium]
MVGEVSMDLLQPDLMAEIVDEGVLKSDVGLIVRVGIRMILFVLLGGLFGVLCGVFANLAAQQFGNDLRKELFSKVMHLSFQQTDRFSTGSLVTRLTNDVTQVQHMVMMSVRGLVRNTVMFLGGIVMLYFQSPRFALVAACAFPFVIIFVTFFLRKASPLFAVVQKKLDGVNHVMQEDVAGARVVKAYVKEEHELNRFDRANEELCSTNLRVQTILAFMGPCMNIVLNTCVILVIVLGGISIKEGSEMKPGQIMAAITYLAQILHGVTFMANIFQIFTRAKASVDRINEVLRCPVVISDGKGETEAIKGKVEFKNVSFAYPNSPSNLVLNDVSFTVNAGETLGIIGATGSGKSTLINLIPRFYDAEKGQVLIDGIDVKEFTLNSLRGQVAVVLQKAELYSRSVEANIRWGDDKADPWAIKSAAEIAQADDFICDTEFGYHTMVTEGGHSLSGGQKQRISLSRAVLKNSKIMILDDSTSALDLKTEAAFFGALNRNFPDTTKIIIAQRIASIKNADRILVLEHGSVASMGTHEELMKASDLYREIYHSQLKEGGEGNA